MKRVLLFIVVVLVVAFAVFAYFNVRKDKGKAVAPPAPVQKTAGEGPIVTPLKPVSPALERTGMPAPSAGPTSVTTALPVDQATLTDITEKAQMQNRILRTLNVPRTGLDEAIRVEKIRLIQQQAEQQRLMLRRLLEQQSRLSKQSLEAIRQAEAVLEQARIHQKVALPPPLPPTRKKSAP